MSTLIEHLINHDISPNIICGTSKKDNERTCFSAMIVSNSFRVQGSGFRDRVAGELRGLP